MLAAGGGADEDALLLFLADALLEGDGVPVGEEGGAEVFADGGVGGVGAEIVELAGVGLEVEEDGWVVQAVDELVAIAAQHGDGAGDAVGEVLAEDFIGPGCFRGLVSACEWEEAVAVQRGDWVRAGGFHHGGDDVYE